MPQDELLELDIRVQEAADRGDEATALELARQMFASGMAMLAHPAVRQVLVESTEGYVSLLQRAGETAAAIRVLEEMAAAIPDGSAGWRQQAGMLRIRSGDAEAGLRQVEAALQEDEADPWRWAGLARALLALHRAPAALDAAGRGLLAADWAPEADGLRAGGVRAVLHELAAEAHYLRADPEAAERSLQAALALGATATPVNLIRLWIAAGQPGRADQWLERLPADETGDYLRGLAVYRSGGQDAAQAYWGPLLRRPPQFRAYDAWWVEAQLLAGDRGAVAAYLARWGVGDEAPFFLQVARGEQPAPDPDPVRNWLAAACLERREELPPADLGPAGELLQRLEQTDDPEDPADAVRRAYRRHGDKLVAGLLAALDGPRGLQRLLAESLLKVLSRRKAVRSSLREYVDDPARSAGARGAAWVILMGERGGPGLIEHPDLLAAAAEREIEGMADLLEFEDYPISDRKDVNNLPAAVAARVLESLPVPGYPPALAFFAWMARSARATSVRSVAERRLRQGLAGATDAGHWLAQGRRLFHDLDFEGAAPCLELAAHLLAPGDPLRDLAMWQWARALLQNRDLDGLRTALRGLENESGQDFWKVQAALLREGVRDARRRDGAVRVRFDPAGHALARLARRFGQDHLVEIGIEVRSVYLAVADQPPPHLDQPAAWAAALLALATALNGWDGTGPLPRWARHLPPAVRAAGAPAATARAVATEVWRVLSTAENRHWLDWVRAVPTP